VSAASRARALPFVGWARIWSPLASRELRDEAWDALGLPGRFADLEPAYWAAFHVGSPRPSVPLLLHAALGLEGGHAREEWMRVLHFLGLRWQEQALPPDHLAPSCEALAAAIDREDDVLVAELCRRYLLPWCAAARTGLGVAHAALGALTERFESDLRALRVLGPDSD